MKDHIIKSPINILRDILFPLEYAISSPEALQQFLERYNVEIEQIEDVNKLIEVLDIKPLFTETEDVFHEWQESGANIELGVKAINLLKAIFQKISSIQNVNFTPLPTEFANADFWGDLFKLILDDLVATYIMDNYLPLGMLLKINGTIETIQLDFQPSTKNVLGLNLDRLSKIFKINEILRTSYGWGDDIIKYENLLTTVSYLLTSINIFNYFAQDISYKKRYFHEQHELLNTLDFLRIPLTNRIDEQGNKHELSINILPVPKDSLEEANLSGILLHLLQTGTIQATDSDNFSVQYHLSSADQDLEIFIYPDQSFISPKDKSKISLEVLIKNSTPIYLLNGGLAGNLSLSHGDLVITSSLENTEKGINPTIHLQLKDLELELSQNDSDNFSSTIFNNLSTHLKFTIDLYWSWQDGLYIGGSSALELVLNVNKGAEALKIEKIRLGFSSVEKNLNIKLTADFFAKLGILQFAVDDVGVQGKIKKNENGSNNLGFADIDIDFKRPSSIACVLNSALITGGGFLEFDPDNHRYAGILALQLKTIDLTAIGLISTRLPNNKPGFSMLISISAIFNPPIELSFGFNLAGVGGLIGMNRTMKVDILRQKILAGNIDSIMFPKEVIKNADRIISDLRAIFPPKDKHFVVAPFLRIGWGTNQLIEVDLSVLLEFPFKGRVILLGSIGVYLPTKAKPLSQLNIDVIGDFNFAAEYIQVEGRLRKGSHVAKIALSGGFAFVLSWDKRPQFLFSVGGYHPRYKKPARFPSIPRLAALIQKGKSLKLTCECYQAITSNSFQIGFRADLFLRYKKAKAHGYFSFDTLIYFDPFYFEAQIAMGATVHYRRKKLAGVSLAFSLTGPRPWTAKGRARIKVAFIKFKIKFKLSWGKKQKVAPRIVDPNIILNKLEKAFTDSNNWAAKTNPRLTAGELLRPIEDAENQLILHPTGHLEVRQTIVPLNRRIRKYGTAVVRNQPIFQIESVKIGGNDVLGSGRRSLKEYFARGQYDELSDAQKISSPDFELFTAGYSLTKLDNVDAGQATDLVELATGYEEITIGGEIAESERDTVTLFRTNAGGRMRHFQEQPQQAFALYQTVPTFTEEELYYIVSVADFSQIYQDLSFDSQMEAAEFLQQEQLTATDYVILSESQWQQKLAA